MDKWWFIFEPLIFKYLKSDKTVLEQEPLTILGKKVILTFKHYGFGNAWTLSEIKRY